jgi:hypothetical protein
MPSSVHLIEQLPSVAPDGEFIRVTFPTGRVHVYRPSVFQAHIDACQKALDEWFIEASKHRAVMLPARHLRREPPALLDKPDVRVKRRRGDPPA